jgi:hypothetical protein
VEEDGDGEPAEERADGEGQGRVRLRERAEEPRQARGGQEGPEAVLGLPYPRHEAAADEGPGDDEVRGRHERGVVDVVAREDEEEGAPAQQQGCAEDGHVETPHGSIEAQTRPAEGLAASGSLRKMKPRLLRNI